MKSEIWPDNVSMPEMTDWLAELRNDGPAEAAGDGDAPRSPDSHPYPEPLAPAQEAPPAPAQKARPVSPEQTGEPAEGMPPSWVRVLARASTPSETAPSGWAWTRAAVSTPSETAPTGWAWTRAAVSTPPETGTSAETGASAEADPLGEVGPFAEADAPAEAEPVAEAAASAEITTRAVIGDELRMPVMWCEMGSCISRHADPAALGEADARARAIAAGWRVDALGRLVCPQCQQTAPSFRVSRPVVPWDRRTAVTTAARMAGWHSSGAPQGHGHNPRRPADGHPAVSPPQPGRHRGRPAAEARPAGQRA
jgi:hypothetical protein